MNYPEAYQFLDSIVPGGLEIVKFQDTRLNQNEWPEEWELPLGDGLVREGPNRFAHVTTKRGTRFTLELTMQDTTATIMPKLISQGASVDDSILDVTFVKSASTDSYLQEAVEEQRETQDFHSMSSEQLRAAMAQLRGRESAMKVDMQVWQNMGSGGSVKAEQSRRELERIEAEKVLIKQILKTR